MISDDMEICMREKNVLGNLKTKINLSFYIQQS